MFGVLALAFSQLGFLIKVSIKIDREFMLVDDLHRIHAFLYIPTKRIFYHFGFQNAYFTIQNDESSLIIRKNGRVDWI